MNVFSSLFTGLLGNLNKYLIKEVSNHILLCYTDGKSNNKLRDQPEIYGVSYKLSCATVTAKNDYSIHFAINRFIV